MTIQNQPHKSFSASCPLCGSTGWVNAIHRTHKSNYAFKCGQCGSAANRGISQSVPEWNKEKHAANYELWTNWQNRKGWLDEVKTQGGVSA